MCEMRRVEKFSNLSHNRLLTTAVSSIRIRFAFELLKNIAAWHSRSSRCSGEPIEFGVTVENPLICTGPAHARILRVLISCADSSRIPGHELVLRRRPVPGSRSYPIATVSSSRSSRIASFSSKGKADDSARVCRLCLRQAARSSGDNEFREAGLFTFTLRHVAAPKYRAAALHRQGP